MIIKFYDSVTRNAMLPDHSLGGATYENRLACVSEHSTFLTAYSSNSVFYYIKLLTGTISIHEN